jgi:two-component system response regulator RegX3
MQHAWTVNAGAPVRRPPALGWMTGNVLVARSRAGCPLADALRGEGLTVEASDDGATVLEHARSGRFALLVVDIVFPGLGGLEGCRRIRDESDVPIVIVTARNSEADRVLGLEAGADDYVCEPFSIAELISRVRAILRRRQLDLQPRRPGRRVGELVIDFATYDVTLGGEPVCLTPSEFRLLAFLSEEPGRAFSPHEILSHLWRSRYVGEYGACKAHISNLRHKIEADPGHPSRVVTVRGVGYALQAT